MMKTKEIISKMSKAQKDYETKQAIKKGFSIMLLIDQKDNAGETVKLFNYNVKTQLGFLKIFVIGPLQP